MLFVASLLSFKPIWGLPSLLSSGTDLRPKFLLTNLPSHTPLPIKMQIPITKLYLIFKIILHFVNYSIDVAKRFTIKKLIIYYLNY